MNHSQKPDKQAGDDSSSDARGNIGGPTRQVDVDASWRTITEYLSDHGLNRGVSLDEEGLDAASILLRVKGGGKYEMEDAPLAEGGMGAIYRARDLNCRRQVAMKVLPKDQQSNTEDLLRLIEEAQITSQLEHPNIVPVHELAIDDNDNIFYTMKLIKGSTLTDVLLGIRRDDPEIIEQYPLAKLLTIFQKICDAVALAHSKQVVHRDLKPDNIMIGDYGELLVMDWGLAKVLGREMIETGRPESVPPSGGSAAGSPKPRSEKEMKELQEAETIDSVRTDEIGSDLRTMSGRIMGTPGFMAPEQASPGGEGLSPRSDIYSLGAILYAILTLRPPVVGKDVKEILRKIHTGDIVAPCIYNDPEQLRAVSQELKPTNHAHCPGGQIPPVLSDIAMKALSTDPDERYQTVKALQDDVEAYQNGHIWHLIIDEEFADPETFARHWEVVGGQHEMKRGECRLYGGEPQLLLLRRALSGDVRIEFTCRQESVYLNTIGCFTSSIPSQNGKEIPSSGYEFKYGGYDNSLNVLMRSDQKIWTESATSLKRGEVYHVVAERVGSMLSMTVNDELVFRVVDDDPLSGADRTAVGLLGWMADTRYTNIRIYSLGTPWKSDILDMAERQLQKGNYVTAADLFQEVLDSFPDADREQQAIKGRALAMNRDSMSRSLPKWKAHLEEAWPEANVQIRMDNDGLTVEISESDVSDLSPLAGLPITSLYCQGNAIQSLAPLEGMQLRTLNCSSNPIRDLSPLDGMPLKTLLCENCGITDISALRHLPLTMLNCGGNPLESGVADLKGLALTWLSCWNTGSADLRPLHGMRLQALYCDANGITDLSPLRDMPLNLLNCGGNKINSLKPLEGKQLTVLHCGDNSITDLEPLRGMSLTMLSCHCNWISDLSPLEGMPLGALACGGNECRTIGALADQPPSEFLFFCDTMSADYLQELLGTWSDDERYNAHRRNTAVMIAMKNNDVDALRLMAAEFRGAKYLFIPRFLKWIDAKEYCENLGGQLVTILDKEENDFVSSMFPAGSWFWIGLVTTKSGHQWVTHEPCRFTAFVDNVRARMLGPKVFFNGGWSSDVYQDAHNCFIIKWNS